MSKDEELPVILAEGLRIEMGGVPIVRDLDLELRKGEKLLISGDSGSGKSSLLSAFLGFLPVTVGKLEVFGFPVQDDRVWEVREQTAYLPQEYELKLDSVRELFFFPFRFKTNRGRKPTEEEAGKALESLGLRASYLDRHPDAISGGEKQRVIAASLLQLDKSLYLLDEPSSGLDRYAAGTLIDGVLSDPERTVVVAAHDAQWRERVDRVLELG